MSDDHDESRRNGASSEAHGPDRDGEAPGSIGLLAGPGTDTDPPSDPLDDEPGAGPADDDPPTPADPAARASSPLRRTVALGVALVVLGALVGLVTALLSPTQYAGRATVLYIISQDQPTGFLREDRNLTTQALLATSQAVLAPVSAQFGLTPEALAQKVTVTVPEGSELLIFEVLDPSPQLAARLADAITRQYLQVSAAFQPTTDQMRYLQEQLTAARAEIQQLRADGSAASLAQLQAVADRAGDLSSQLDVLMLGQVARPQAQLVVPAFEGGAVGPRPALAAATGAVAGLLVALAAAALLAWRWQRRGPGA